MPVNNPHTVLIEKLVPGGFGLGRLPGGLVVLVRFVLPGEHVLVREISRRKDFIEAALQEVLAPSPDRIEPPCPIYGRCGGCNLQHATPDAQLHLKKAMLIESLQRAAEGFFYDPATSIRPPLASAKQFGYRQRLRFQIDSKGRCGFFRPQSHILEPVEKCLLAADPLNRVLERLHTNNSLTELAQQCSSLELLCNPDSSDTIILLHFKRKPRATDSMLAAGLADSLTGPSTILMLVQGHGLYDPLGRTFSINRPTLSQTISVGKPGTDIVLSWEAGGFSQVNPEQNKNMIKLVLELVAGGPHVRVLDLFCGYGNFSVPVSQAAGEVLGIDSQNAAIRSARRNAQLAGAHNCHFEKNQVEAGVRTLSAAEASFDTVILDPPRQGAGPIISLLPGLGAEQIIYISCNPPTLARDLALLHREGYLLSCLVPVDMFPQTHHLESIALLKRAVI